ncbi:unnamed protein product [Medioppia subpectinata]|uniref:Calcineurin-like phosphoesterase domain-containing protein n=1 Tax=Medioppia subpectinata TaxID=1979941 RepID=A0A7R9KX03_9ACAR|nr:unnamed protein product [Medioppia subpectinata]CAG2111198.1 unnamed protein product [Medioppia subpectinata]
MFSSWAMCLTVVMKLATPSNLSKSVDSTAPIINVINGNHDIGFHYAMTTSSKSRFDHSFNTSAAKLIQINGINFVTINSVTMEGDYCHLCSRAVQQLRTIGHQLRDYTDRPVVLTHYPLYRRNETDCDNKGYDADSMPESDRLIPYRPKWDCLSANATRYILDTLRPRLVVNGHTHYGCHRRHAAGSVDEWTVGAFNYRHASSPSVLLAVVSPHLHKINKCLLASDLMFHAIDAIFSMDKV